MVAATREFYMSKSKRDEPAKVGRPSIGKPVHVRIPLEIMADLELIEQAHGLDTSSAIRMILTEARHDIVERAKETIRIRKERGIE